MRNIMRSGNSSTVLPLPRRTQTAYRLRICITNNISCCIVYSFASSGRTADVSGAALLAQSIGLLVPLSQQCSLCTWLSTLLSWRRFLHFGIAYRAAHMAAPQNA